MSRFTNCRGCGLGATWAEFIRVGIDGYCGELCKSGVRWDGDGSPRVPSGWRVKITYRRDVGLSGHLYTLTNDRGVVVHTDREPQQ